MTRHYGIFDFCLRGETENKAWYIRRVFVLRSTWPKQLCLVSWIRFDRVFSEPVSNTINIAHVFNLSNPNTHAPDGPTLLGDEHLQCANSVCCKCATKMSRVLMSLQFPKIYPVGAAIASMQPTPLKPWIYAYSPLLSETLMSTLSKVIYNLGV